MRATPLAQAPSFPVTVVTAAVAIGVSLAYWSDGNVDVLFMGASAFWREPWRLVTSMFPHGHVFHLLFNVVWLWIFGTWVERELGHVKLAGILLLTAAGSAAAQFAVGTGGIGLSGTGYGLLGFLWATARYDPRRRDAMDARTVRLFLGWGLLCLGLTMLGVWNIANTAHAVGLVLGFALGAARALTGAQRAGAVLALAAVLAAGTAGATALRPWVALFDREGHAHCYEGWRALDKEDVDAAVAQFDQAARYPNRSASCAFNTGIAYTKVGRFKEAQAAYRAAIELDPSYEERLTLDLGDLEDAQPLTVEDAEPGSNSGDAL